MTKIYFGLLRGIRVAAESPYLVWENTDGGRGSAFETYSEAADVLNTKNGEWKKQSGKAGDSPFAIYCLLNGEWVSIECFCE